MENIYNKIKFIMSLNPEMTFEEAYKEVTGKNIGEFEDGLDFNATPKDSFLKDSFSLLGDSYKYFTPSVATKPGYNEALRDLKNDKRENIQNIKDDFNNIKNEWNDDTTFRDKLKDRFGFSKEKREARQEYRQDKRDLNKEYGVNPAANVISGRLTIANGASGILGNAINSINTPNPVGVSSKIGSINNIQSSSYMNNSDIINGYRNINSNSGIYGEDFRGMSNLDKAGNIASSTLTGATTGMQVGGPWGAAIGGAIGAGAAIGSNWLGDQNAKANKSSAISNMRLASNNASNNLNASLDSSMKSNYNSLRANRIAEGGKITTASKKKNMSVIDFMDKVNEMKKFNKLSEGGSTHGVTFNVPGLVHIGAGGTHEENRYGGVPVGIDNEGNPNLVEENENIYNDYVFSDRLKPTKSELKKYIIPEKYYGKTFAEISDSLADEAKTRENDPVSNNGLGVMLDRLTSCHEEHKQRLEEKRYDKDISNMYNLGIIGDDMTDQNVYGPGGLMRSLGRVVSNKASKVVENAPRVTKNTLKKIGKSIYDTDERAEMISNISKMAENKGDEIINANKKVSDLENKVKTLEKNKASIEEINEAKKQLLLADSELVKLNAKAIASAPIKGLGYIDAITPVIGGPYRYRIPYNEEVNVAQKSYDEAVKSLETLKSNKAKASEIKDAEEIANNALNDLNKAKSAKNKYITHGNFIKTTGVVSGAGTAAALMYDHRKRKEAEDILGTVPVESSDDNSFDDGGKLQEYTRYAPAYDLAFKSMLTALQSPDKTLERGFNSIADNLPSNNTYYNPALVGYRYSPVDEQMVNNSINAESSANRSAALNSGYGPSSGALLVAMNDSTSRAIGNNAYNVSNSNTALRNQIAQQINSSELQRANGLMQSQSDNYNRALNMAQLASQYRYYGLNATENDITSRASALTKNTKDLAKVLGDIGTENFRQNQINGDKSKYWIKTPKGDYIYIGPRYEDSAEGGILLKKHK